MSEEPVYILHGLFSFAKGEKELDILEYLNHLHKLCSASHDSTKDGVLMYWKLYNKSDRLQIFLHKFYKTEELLNRTSTFRNLCFIKRLCGRNAVKALKHFDDAAKLVNSTNGFISAEIRSMLYHGFNRFDYSAVEAFGNELYVYSKEKRTLYRLKDRFLANSYDEFGMSKEFLQLLDISASFITDCILVDLARDADPGLCSFVDLDVGALIKTKEKFISIRDHIENYKVVFHNGFAYLYSTDWQNEPLLMGFAKESVVND